MLHRIDSAFCWSQSQALPPSWQAKFTCSYILQLSVLFSKCSPIKWYLLSSQNYSMLSGLYVKLYLDGNWNGIECTKVGLFLKYSYLLQGGMGVGKCLLFKINQHCTGFVGCILQDLRVRKYLGQKEGTSPGITLFLLNFSGLEEPLK